MKTRYHLSCSRRRSTIGYGEAQMKASDWSKHYANHLVTSLIDRSDQKWSNQNGESSENRRLWNVIG